MCVYDRMYVYMYICVYAYTYVYIGKRKAFERNLQAATKHNKQYKECRSTRFIQVLNVIKRQTPQELQCLNMCSVPNLFYFVLVIIPTSVSIPFINWYRRFLPFVIRMKNFIKSTRKNKFIICNMRCAIVCTVCTVSCNSCTVTVPYVPLASTAVQ